MIELVQSMIRDEAGATMVEYGVLVGFVALVCIAAITALGQNLSTLYSTFAGSI